MAKVLLVDDMIELLEGEQELIEECLGCEVTATSLPEEAMKMIDAAQFDLAVIDLRMPIVDGITMLKKIKSKHRFPVMIYSAYLDRELPEKLKAAGADLILTKPAAPDLFLNAIKTLLEPESKKSIVIVDGYKIQEVNNHVLERKIQEALAGSKSKMHEVATSLALSDEYLAFLINKFHLGR